MKVKYIFFLAIIMLIIGILAGFILDKPRESIIISERTDTLIIYDTISLPPPPPKIVYIDRVETITLPSVIERDTVYIAVEIPIEVKVFETADYKAQISGFKPELLSIDIYRRTEYVNRTETIKVPDNRRFSLGLQLGYGAGLKNGQVQLYPYIGLGVSYNFIRW